MTNSENSTGNGQQNQFQVSRIQYLSWKQFNGKLHVQADLGQKWDLFFNQGRLLWTTGNIHPMRRWQRHLIQYCPNIAPANTRFRGSDDAEHWQYNALTILVKRQHISEKQATSVITEITSEVLFDIIQQTLVQQLSYIYNAQNVLDDKLILIDTELALKQASEAWEAWRGAGLAKISPNLAPIIKKPDQLQQETSPAVYQNFVNLINGNNTMRDLAVRMKQDLLLLTRSLIPYIRKGIIGLTEIADLPQLAVENTSVSLAIPEPIEAPQEKAPLIACVDDSPQTCQMMQQIFKAAGFQFISIQNSVEALPTLLEKKPELVFLDLMMPVVNGYELCSQLRRVAMFANTPMIILTGSDGLIDRVRAKMVGASDFVTKPVEAQKVLSVVRKYLPDASPNLKTSKLEFSPNS